MGIFIKVNNSCRIHHIFSITITFAIMLFNIFYFSVLFYIECVNSYVLGCVNTTIMNTTSGNNCYITVFSNIEVIVYGFLVACLT